MSQPRYLDIVTFDAEGAFQTLVVAGVKEMLAQTPYTLRVKALRHAPQSRYSPDKNVHGVIIIANALPDADILALQARDLPVTLVSHQTQLALPSVRFNNAQGISLLVKHLLKDCQRRKIVFIRGIMAQIDAKEREIAFRQELMRHHISIDEMLFLSGEFTPEIASESIHGLLKANTFFDGVLASDYAMAGAIVQLLQSQGVAVPQQVAVVGFGDAQEAEALGITTVSADVQELGRRATRQMLHQMRGIPVYGTTTLSVQLVIRQTSQ